MNKEEKMLFKKICNFKSKNLDEELLEYAGPCVLGHLFFNRMQGVAYGNLKEKGMLGKVNREFRNSLKGAYEQNVEKNQSFFKCVRDTGNVLSKCSCKYAMLKGAVLCGKYPLGYRTSNDIDILVDPDSVTEVGKLLEKDGFKRGNIRNGEFVEATRKEIIESKMMRGEVVPYIKKVQFPGMKYLEIDINFSLDYKNGEKETIEEILKKAEKIDKDGVKFYTLRRDDFFIHLCSHLYKEATTLPWIEMKRDMTLYKYCDIYLLLSEMQPKELENIFTRAKKLSLEKICAFAVMETAAMFEVDKNIELIAKNVLKEEPEFIHTVISPSESKIFRYEEKDIFERFFAGDRRTLLKEIIK